MGLIASKTRVKSTLSTTAEFHSACDSAFTECLSLTQHAFPGVFPYQLPTASILLQRSLSTVPLIHKWVPSPPTRSQIDSALLVVSPHHRPSDEGPQTLDRTEFKEWAMELFGEAIVSNAGKAVLTRVPIGIAGIAGLGLATRSGKELVGSAIGVYALGVAASVYLGLSGLIYVFF